MKIYFSRLIFYWIWILGTGEVFGQTTVGMGTENPNSNAVLELVSENMDQGFLVPRFTTDQRTASGFSNKLSNKDNGLLVFDTDEGNFYYWYEGGWQQGIATGSLGGTSTVWYTGNTIPRNNEGKNGDFYIHTLSGDVYRKENEKFIVIGNMQPQKNQYSAGSGIDIEADNTIVNTGDLDNANELINNVTLTGETLRITEAGVNHDIALSSFQKVTLNNGEVRIGNASNVATPVTIDGDATLANNGKLLVKGLQGNPVANISPSNGNVLTWNGTAWEAQMPSGGGGSGASWYEGLVIPNAGNPIGAVNGDYYYKTDNETFYRKESGSWIEQGKWFKPSGNSVGSQTITEIYSPTMYVGTGKPKNNAGGKTGDMYYDSNSGEFYIRSKDDKWKKL